MLARARYVARPLSDRPGARRQWAVVRIGPGPMETYLAYGAEALCVRLAAYLQAREDGATGGAPPPPPAPG